MKSRFIISLDFELLWGVRDKRTIETYGANIRGVRQVIPALLELFERYDIAATFATVGFLFARSKEEMLAYIPDERPVYSQPKYSPYENNYLSQIGNSEADDIYHFGASLMEQIRQSPKQELATHTFSHYYCLEGATLSSFEADLIAAKRLAGTYGIELKSIVFPRNQYSEAHLAVCRHQGILAYRGNETSSVYQPRANDEQSKWIRATRLADSYLNLTGHHTFCSAEVNGMVNIPASRFLRPFSPRLKSLDRLRLQRIKQSMTHAARTDMSYHLWWHPHNFGVNLEENCSFLEAILRHYQFLNTNYGMQSKTMYAIAEETLRTHVV